MGAKRKKPTTLALPPFPPLTWDGHSWIGHAVLKSWEGFQARLGAYGSESSDRPSDGTVWLDVDPAEPPPSETSRKQPPAPAQADAYRHLVEHQNAIRDNVLRAVVEFYNAVAHLYIEAGKTDLPLTLVNPDQLREMIGPSFVHVLAEVKDGVPYVGFQFGCVWDGEHGLGVMTHKGEVIDVGQAETAFCPPWPGGADSWPQTEG